MVTEQEQDQELPERWSVKAKTEVVLRLLRGEAVGAVSRKIQVPAHEREAWRRVFLESGQTGLKRWGADPRRTGAEASAGESGGADGAEVRTLEQKRQLQSGPVVCGCVEHNGTSWHCRRMKEFLKASRYRVVWEGQTGHDLFFVRGELRV